MSVSEWFPKILHALEQCSKCSVFSSRFCRKAFLASCLNVEAARISFRWAPGPRQMCWCIREPAEQQAEQCCHLYFLCTPKGTHSASFPLHVFLQDVKATCLDIFSCEEQTCFFFGCVLTSLLLAPVTAERDGGVSKRFGSRQVAMGCSSGPCKASLPADLCS